MDPNVPPKHRTTDVNPVSIITKASQLVISGVTSSRRRPTSSRARLRAKGRVNNVLGFDASGAIAKAGTDALFKMGNKIIFAGVLGHSGLNARYAAIDLRIAGCKCRSWTNGEAAALPLIGLCHFNLVPFSRPEEMLIIVNGAGGVGTMATQLA